MSNTNGPTYLELYKDGPEPPRVIDLRSSGLSGGDALMDSLLASHPYELQRLRKVNRMWGNTEFRSLVMKRYGMPADTVVLPTSGSTGWAVALAAYCLRPAKTVLVEQPGYKPFEDAARVFGLQVVGIKRRAESKYVISPNSLSIAISSVKKEEIGMSVVSAPMNPGGARMSLKHLVKLADRFTSEAGHDSPFVVDETFLPPPPSQSPGKSRSVIALSENCVVINTLSKTFGLSARAGYIAARGRFIKRLKPAWTHVVNNAGIAEDLGAIALTHSDEFAQKHREISEANRAELKRALKLSGSRLTGDVPRAGLTAWLTAPGRDNNQLADKLREDVGVNVIPGNWLEVPGFRVGLGVDPGDFKEGMKRIVDFLKR